MRRARREAPPYVQSLIEEWGLAQGNAVVRRLVSRVLSELTPGVQLLLRREPRLQVTVSDAAFHDVWAYFPLRPERRLVNRERLEESLGDAGLDHEARKRLRSTFDSMPSIGEIVDIRPGASVLLLMNGDQFRSEQESDALDHLRDHLGHTLLYLRSPRAANECTDATREWEESCCL
jgi:hypothetical protein